jgi:hypothetical protein
MTEKMETPEIPKTVETTELPKKQYKTSEAQRRSSKKYNESHKDKYAVYNREYYRNKYRNNPEYSQMKKEYYLKKKAEKAAAASDN